MFQKWIIVILLLQAPSALADAYWVVGSFANKINATREATQLAEALNANVEARYVDNLAMYRVLVPADVSMAEINATGRNGWKAELAPPADGTFIAHAPAPASPVIPEPGPAAPAVIQDEAAPMHASARPAPTVAEEASQPLYPPFLPGESQVEYCARLPDSALCEDPRVKSMIARLKEIEEKKLILRSHCEKQSNRAEMDICRDWLNDTR